MFVLKIVLSLLFWITCPIICLLSVPFYVYRQLIKSLVKHFRPDWLGMLAVSDAVFYENLKVDSDPYENQNDHGDILNLNSNNKPHSLSNIMTLGLVLEGEPNLDKIRSFFSEHILNYKNNGGDAPFEKFHCFSDAWCGYPFWRRSKYFDLNCHIRFLDEFENKRWTTRRELNSFLGDYYSKPFPWKTPPWELVIVKNLILAEEEDDATLGTVEEFDDELDGNGYGDVHQRKFVTDTKRFALIFRWHRTIADNYSIASIFINSFGGENLHDCRYDFGSGYYCEPTGGLLELEISPWKGLKLAACSFISFGYETMKLFLMDFDQNIWRIPEEVLCGSYHVVETNQLPFNIARTVSKKRKVSIDAVLFSAVAGGIRQYFIQSGQQRRIPKVMRIRGNVPFGSGLRQHRHFCGSEILANNWRQLSVRLPVRQSESWRRLEEVHKSIEQQNISLVPKIVRMISPYLTALLPVCLNVFSVRHEGSSLTGWYFPGPKNQLLILGEYPGRDFICHQPKLLSGSSLCLTIISYNGAIKYIISVDKTLFPHRESALKLAKLIENEFLSSQNINSHYANEL